MQLDIFNKLFIEDYKDIIKPQSPFHLWFFSNNWKLKWNNAKLLFGCFWNAEWKQSYQLSVSYVVL